MINTLDNDVNNKNNKRRHTCLLNIKANAKITIPKGTK